MFAFKDGSRQKRDVTRLKAARRLSWMVPFFIHFTSAVYIEMEKLYKFLDTYEVLEVGVEFALLILHMVMPSLHCRCERDIRVSRI